MENVGDYKNLITEIVRKQMDILGPEMAIGKARKVSGLVISEDGAATGLDGDPHQVLQKLVDEYIALSGEIVKNILDPVFMKYPGITLNLK